MWFDLRDVLKSLRRTPGYSATVVLTLGLTVGATTAVFSIVDGVLLKPLAYRESHRIVAIRELWKQFSGPLEVNEQHFEYWRSHVQAFEAIAQYNDLSANLTGVGDAVQIDIVRATGTLFDVLRVHAARGRALTPDDERPDRPRVVVISDESWRKRFSSDPGIVGRSITIDGRSHTVVGVLPHGFNLGDRADRHPEAYVPIRMAEEHVGWFGDHNNKAIARLKHNVGVVAAEAELNVLQAQVSALATAQAHEPVVLAASVVPLVETVVGRARRGLLLLFAAIVAVLLIACSNLASLSLTRAAARQRDAALRAALGASRSRLASRALLEQTCLSIAGGGLGAWVAWAALELFVRTAPIDLPRAQEVRLDAAVLSFAAAVTIVSGLLVAMAPAWRLSSAIAQGAMRSSSTTFTGDRSALRARSLLLAAQVSLSVVLLVVTALIGLSFVRLVRVDRGFDATRVLAVAISAPTGRDMLQPGSIATYDRVLSAVRALPGVEAVSTTSMLPMRGQGQVNFIVADGDHRPRAEQPTANFRFVGPDFFRTLGIVIVRGHSFTDDERDASTDLPAVISEKTAARLWPHGDAMGQHFSRGLDGERGFVVTGIVSNERTTSLEAEPPLMVYVPYWWRERSTATLMVRAAADPAALTASIRQAIARIDTGIAIGDARPLEQIVDASFAARRYQVRLFVAFGITALAIAIVGVYGVTAYGVARRRREMNIRVALGAERSQVTRMIVRQGFAPVAVGVAAGVGGAIAAGGVVASLLFDVDARDPIVLTAVAAVVAASAGVACVAAARQGLRLNPAAALREE